MKARKGLFKAPGLMGEYEGYVYDSPFDTWNGHPQPMFTGEVVYQMIEDIKKIGGCIEDTEDGELFLYPIGAGAWYWEEKR